MYDKKQFINNWDLILVLGEDIAEELGLLWGIYDLELANQFKGDYDLKELTRRYGLQCQD